MWLILRDELAASQSFASCLSSPHHPLTHMAKGRHTAPSHPLALRGWGLSFVNVFALWGSESSHQEERLHHTWWVSKTERERTSGILPGPESYITYREIDLLLYNIVGKSLLMVIAFILMKQKGPRVYSCRKMTFIIFVWCCTLYKRDTTVAIKG